MLETAVRRATTGKRLVLAVSGGRDSMALLHVVARVAPRTIRMVATFDHGTGRTASQATLLVARETARLGFPVVVGRGHGIAASEAAWRDARLRFLHDVASRTDAAIATAHTRDDQIETVLMRVLRDAGPRGLAGLYAGGSVVRPLLDISREDVARYASAVGARWVDDPTNESTRFLRNRIRRDLLPALARAHPSVADELLDVARRSAAWRRRVDALVREFAVVDEGRRRVTITAARLEHSLAELAVIWPAVAARVGLYMDRRGTIRAAEFTTTAAAGARMQLSGGWEILRSRDGFELRPVHSSTPTEEHRVLGDGAAWNSWRFAAVRTAPAPHPRDPWMAWLPVAGQVTVRPWQPGDRMRVQSGETRKVKRFLSDARITGPRRLQWPVVLVDGEIVWIPGVRRGGAGGTDAIAGARTGEPGVVYRCELDESRR